MVNVGDTVAENSTARRCPVMIGAAAETVPNSRLETKGWPSMENARKVKSRPTGMEKPVTVPPMLVVSGSG